MTTATIETATRRQKIDFLYNNVLFGGKRFTKTKLNAYSDDELDLTLNIVFEKIKGMKERYIEYLNTPKIKLTKFIAECTDKDGKNFSIEGKFETAEAFEEDLKADGYSVQKIVTGKDHHVCKYCIRIADGKDKDLLCDNCRELFGHTFYSEL